MNMNIVRKSLFAAALALFASAQANELDNAPQGRPTGIVSRKNLTTGEVEVFTMNGTQAVKTDAAALEAAQSLNEANRIAVRSGSELDQNSSTPAWFYWNWYGGYYPYYYSYWNYGYNYYYYPCYSYYYGPYYYNYYWWY